MVWRLAAAAGVCIAGREVAERGLGGVCGSIGGSRLAPLLQSASAAGCLVAGAALAAIDSGNPVLGVRVLRIGEDGWLVEGARRCASPNCDERPMGGTVSLIVVHAISLPPDEFGGPGVEQLFTNRLDPEAHPYYAEIALLRVSAHFFIRRTGELIQFVSTEARAWHAGQSCWGGRERCNDFSVGIELEGCDTRPFEAAQYECLRSVVEAVRARYPIADVVGHSDIAPGRKTDPGPCFEWGAIGVVR